MSLLPEKQISLLPTLLAHRADEYNQFRFSNSKHFSKIEKEVLGLEKLLSNYKIDFPFFCKVDAWRAYHENVDQDLWILERIGWGKWKRKFRLLYVMEGLSIPRMGDAEIVTVNSLSPPFLGAARELCWTDEIFPEEVQACQLVKMPNALKEKTYPLLEEFASSLSVTLEKMEVYDKEFSEFLEDKIQDYIAKTGAETKANRIENYFRHDRRVELFHEFLDLGSDSSAYDPH